MSLPGRPKGETQSAQHEGSTVNFNDADITLMQAAVDASSRALQAGNMPFGASLASASGEHLWTAMNNQVTEGDCTGHAELVLVREVTQRLGAAALRGATVYASGEPCAMCSGAMFWAGIQRVVFGATQADIAAALGAPVLPMTCAQTLSGATPAVVVQGPLLREQAAAVLNLMKSS
jgi:tRNA(adenine34) deaminase